MAQLAGDTWRTEAQAAAGAGVPRQDLDAQVPARARTHTHTSKRAHAHTQTHPQPNAYTRARARARSRARADAHTHARPHLSMHALTLVAAAVCSDCATLLQRAATWRSKVCCNALQRAAPCCTAVLHRRVAPPCCTAAVHCCNTDRPRTGVANSLVTCARAHVCMRRYACARARVCVCVCVVCVRASTSPVRRPCSADRRCPQTAPARPPVASDPQPA